MRCRLDVSRRPVVRRLTVVGRGAALRDAMWRAALIKKYRS